MSIIALGAAGRAYHSFSELTTNWPRLRRPARLRHLLRLRRPPGRAPATPLGAGSFSACLTLHNVEQPLINVSGCPPHPDCKVGTNAITFCSACPNWTAKAGRRFLYPDTHGKASVSYFEAGKFAMIRRALLLGGIGLQGPDSHCV
jgi:hypothetical protein